MTSPSPFLFPVRVRFGECDPAGIAYFPRIFDWFHEAMEAWFDEGLEHPYAEVIGRGIGFPAVHSEADFARPCRMGDHLVVRLSVERLGARSVTLAYTVTGAGDAGDLRATGRTVVAVTDLRALRAIPVPADLREAMARWVTP